MRVNLQKQAMAKIKTRDLILEIALILLNDKGERPVTAVELANEMNISPGNLYYHFKGKEEIVEALYAQFHASLVLVMENISSTSHINAKSMLVYLGLIWDIFDKYRFISQDAINICAQYPNIKPQMGKALTKLHAQILSLLDKMATLERLETIDNSANLLADNLLNTLLHGYIRNDLLLETSNEGSIKELVLNRLHLQLLPFIDEHE